jgi:acyl carrier protein
LPAPGRPYRDLSRPLTLPRNPTETTVAQIWGEVLGHDTVDVHDHFYDLGGESLQALRIMAKIRRTFSVNADLQSLIDAPTVAEMALQITKLMEAGTEAQPLVTPNASERDSDRNNSICSRLSKTSAILFALWPTLSF